MSSHGGTGHRLAYIDGLRALAVIPVVLFHLGLAAVPGGFLGVDVFFVISGFVIARSLSTAHRDEQTTLSTYLEGFYRRRFWRLAPALGVTLLVTFAFCVFALPPGWLSEQNAATGLAAVFGVSNIALSQMGGAGYFEARTEFNPFLHTWSLGVEEQFYVLVPLVLWLGVRVWTNRWAVLGARLVIPLAAVASLVLAIGWTSSDPVQAFYSLPTRFWELAAGVLACQLSGFVARRLTSVTVRLVLAAVGLAAIRAAYDGVLVSGTPVPAAILPVVGAVLVLWCVPGTGLLENVLSVRPLVYIGRISYSLYLWHWPVIVAMKWTIGDTEWWAKVLAVALSFALAAVSFRFVEQYFQHWGPARIALRPKVFAAAVSTVALLAVSVITIGSRSSYTLDIPSMSPVAHTFGWDKLELPSVGRVSQQRWSTHPEVLVVGDSHAGAYAGMATEAANRLDASLRILEDPPCAFKLHHPVDLDACPGLTDELAAIKSGDVVLFAALRLPRYVDQSGPLPDEETVAHPGDSAAISQLADIAGDLTSRGAVVVIDSPKPLFKQVPFRCASWPTNLNPLCDAPPTVPRDELIERAKPSADAIAAVKEQAPDVRVWDAFDVLCPEDPCSLFDRAGHPLYFDQDHLSGWGNDLLLPSFLELVEADHQPA